MQHVLYSHRANLQQVPEIADNILKHISKANILLLEGDLGTGKTTLVKTILKKLGVNSEVTSPTFNLVNEYLSEDGQVFYHFDLYRIRHIGELEEIGFREYLDSGNLCLVEWPEIAEPLIHDKALKLKIVHQEDERLYDLSIIGD